MWHCVWPHDPKLAVSVVTIGRAAVASRAPMAAGKATPFAFAAMM